MKEIVFLGSKPVGARCLDWLLSNAAALQVKVIAVRTQSRKEFVQDVTVESIARTFKIPLIHDLEAMPECDIIYSVQHHEILRQADITKARQVAVNLHLAPLPEYRGCNQFSFAIMDERDIFGVSIHEIDERIDHGRLFFEDRFPIEKEIWVEDLYAISVERGVALFKNTLPEIVAGNYPAIDTSQRISSIHYRSEIQALKQIDLGLPNEEIQKRIRATMMPGFEMPYAIVEGRKIYFTKET